MNILIEAVSLRPNVRKSDTASGKMAAESSDAQKVYTDQQDIKAEKKQIAADKAAQTAVQKK